MEYMKAFSPAEVKEFKRLFMACDSDGSGQLSLQETAGLLANAGEDISEQKLHELYAEIDSNGDGQVSFDEFMSCLAHTKSSVGGIEDSTSASNIAMKFAKAANAQAKIYKVQGAGNSEHSISEDECTGFAEYINLVLARDSTLSKRLPMDTRNDDLFRQCSDGLIFAKLVNIVEPDTIDERALNNNETLSKFQVVENCNLAINAAKSIGCRITNIGASDIMDGRPHLILGIAWQIIRASLLSKVSLKDHPELYLLLHEDEKLEDLMKLPPEQVIIRWVNYHLERAGHSRRMKNYGSDLKDSEIYSVLLHRIDGLRCPLVSGSDAQSRAEQVIVNAKTISKDIITQASDITKGNTKLNLALLAQIFNSNPGLTINAEDMSRLSVDMADLNLDDEGDTREERTFRMWINSLGIEEMYINDLFAGLQNGVELLKIMDKVQPGVVSWGAVSKKQTRFAVIENCNRVVEVAKEMKLVLVNIGGVDICDKNQKLILAITWQLMRKYTCKMLEALSDTGVRVEEVQVVEWANQKVTKSGKVSRMKSMKDRSLSNGLFLLDLCSAVSPCVDWDLITPGVTPEDKLSNARYAISVARKIGACVFLTPEDIVEVKSKMLFTFVASLWAADLSKPLQGASSSPFKDIRSSSKAAAEAPKKKTVAEATKTSKKQFSSSSSTVSPAAKPPAPAPKSVPKPAPKPVPKPLLTTAARETLEKKLPVGATASTPEFSSPKKALPKAPVQIYESSAVKSNIGDKKRFSSINGSGEKGGLYGSSSNHASDEVDVEEDEWDD